MLPFGDEPNPRTLPVVNYALIAANVLVFLFVSLPQTTQAADLNDPALPAYLRMLAREYPGVSPRTLLESVSAYDLFTFEWGFRPAAPSFLTLLTSLFLHGGWVHLLGNMLFLYVFGDNVEDRLGKLGYLAMYLGTGCAATLFFMLFARGSEVPLVGASGAISGVLGCYFWWFPQNRVRLLVVLFWLIDVWRVPARIVLGAYLVLDNIIPFLVGPTTAGGVAHGAHIGGFIAGLGAAMVIGRQGERPFARRRGPNSASFLSPQEIFRRAVLGRRFFDAAEAYAQMSLEERNALDDADVLSLADGLVELGRAEPALALLQRFIATRPKSSSLALAHLKAGLVQHRFFGQDAAARQHWLSALDVDPPPDVARAVRHALAEIEPLN